MNWKKIIRTFLVLLISLTVVGAAVVLRLQLASRSHNWDMQSWEEVADIAAGGKNVYETTTRYNYGPVWFLVLGQLKHVHDALGLQGPESMHMTVAAFLSLCDVGIAAILLCHFGSIPALFFLLNPLSILVTGFHSQMDNLALLPALGAWLLICPAGKPAGQVSGRNFILSALLLGFSLAAKHIMIFFPLWLLVCPALISKLPKRVAYTAIAFGVFLLSFLPFVLSPAALHGAAGNFVAHRASRTALVPHLFDLMGPQDVFDSFFGLLPDWMSLFKLIFIGGMLLVGRWLARINPTGLFYCYLPAIVLLAPLMGDQYLAIPMITCAIYWRRWPTWVYVAMGSAIVEITAWESGAIPGPRPWWINEFGNKIPYYQALFWLLILFLNISSGFPRAWRLVIKPREQAPI